MKCTVYLSTLDVSASFWWWIIWRKKICLCPPRTKLKPRFHKWEAQRSPWLSSKQLSIMWCGVVDQCSSQSQAKFCWTYRLWHTSGRLQLHKMTKKTIPPFQKHFFKFWTVSYLLPTKYAFYPPLMAKLHRGVPVISFCFVKHNTYNMILLILTLLLQLVARPPALDLVA